MQEVEEIPELEPKAKQRLRENLRELARFSERPKPQSPLPPPEREGFTPSSVGNKRLSEDDAGQGGDPHTEHVVAALAPSDRMDDEEIIPPEEAEENMRLAEQLRRCLSLHTERARKISSYIQALLALTEEVHTLRVDA